jgi:CHAT domain-containing protein
MAGFTHVVGTLWSVDDEVSQEVAERFYTAFDSGRVFARDAAHALHDAVRLLRDTDASVRPNPTLWAPYIHVGA